MAKGLGRGLDTLLPTAFDENLLKSNERVVQLALSSLRPNPDQPRKHFDAQALNDLAQSIKSHGIVQPLVVTKNGDFYRIIAGERRWRAAHIAGLKEVPAIVRSMQDLEELEVALIENVQRVDLSPLEQAESIQRLHEQFSMSYGDIATKLGKAPPTITNIVRLLGLPDSAKQVLSDGIISEGHARAILALRENPEKQQELLKLIINNGWSVRQAEQFVIGVKKKNPKPKALEQHMAKTSPETLKLSEKLETNVTIRRTAKGGKLEIHFKNDAHLTSLLKNLTR